MSIICPVGMVGGERCTFRPCAIAEEKIGKPLCALEVDKYLDGLKKATLEGQLSSDLVKLAYKSRLEQLAKQYNLNPDLLYDYVRDQWSGKPGSTYKVDHLI